MTIIQKLWVSTILLFLIASYSSAQKAIYRTLGGKEYSKELNPDEFFHQPWMNDLTLQTARIKLSPPDDRVWNEDEGIRWIKNELESPFCLINNMIKTPGQKTPVINVLFPKAYTNFGRWIPGNVQAEYGPSMTIQYFEPDAVLPVQINTSVSSLIIDSNNPPKEILIFNTVYAVDCKTPGLRSTVMHNEGIVGLLHAAYFGGDQEIENAKKYFTHFKGVLYWSVDRLKIDNTSVN